MKTPRQPYRNHALQNLVVAGVLVIIFLGLTVWVFGKVWYTLKYHDDPEIQQTQRNQYLKNLKIIPTYKRIVFVGVPCMLLGGGMIFVLFRGWSRWRENNIHMMRLGTDVEIPVHYNQIKQGRLADVIEWLVQGVVVASSVPRWVLEMFLRHWNKSEKAFAIQPPEIALPTRSIPTFQDMLSHEMIMPGNPLIFGFNDQGEPEYRSLDTIIALAIAGWQGSGKTISEAYLAAMLALLEAEIHISDPHWSVQGSLTCLLQPLIQVKNVVEWKPMAIRSMLKHFNERLDARLAGTESSERPFVIIIDELNRLIKIDGVFDNLIRFLERCTEEIRKANMIFFGGGHKWSAKHFKGRADIRSCFPSFLIHKMKPSQADLFLEDAYNKKMVKNLHRPGEGILCTNYGDPVKISVPLVTHRDIQDVVHQLSMSRPSLPQLDTKIDRSSHQQIPETSVAPEHWTDGLLIDRDLLDAVKRRLSHEKIAQKDLCAQYNLDASYFSKLLRGERKKLSSNYRQALQRFLAQK